MYLELMKIVKSLSWQSTLTVSHFIRIVTFLYWQLRLMETENLNDFPFIFQWCRRTCCHFRGIMFLQVLKLEGTDIFVMLQ